MKKQKPCLNILTKAYLESMANCCGVGELGGFPSRTGAMENTSMWDSDTYSYKSIPAKPATLQDVQEKFREEGFKTVLATTIPSQKDAAQALKAAGFKRITTTPSREDPRRTISLWMWKDKREKRK